MVIAVESFMECAVIAPIDIDMPGQPLVPCASGKGKALQAILATKQYSGVCF